MLDIPRTLSDKGEFKMNVKTTQKSFSNKEIMEKLQSLRPILTQRNAIGYIAARNSRTLNEALTEYKQFEQDAIMRYGTADVDENGRPLGTTSIRPESEGFQKFIEEMAPLQSIEQTLAIMVTKYEDVIGVLSGEEILAVDWMLED